MYRIYLLIPVLVCAFHTSLERLGQEWNFIEYWYGYSLGVFIFGPAVGFLIGGAAVITIDLVFGNRPFVFRWLEYAAWVGVCTVLFIGPMPDWQMSVILMIPATCIIAQMPFWGIAYTANWELTSADRCSQQSAWTLHDWVIGSVLLSTALALLNAALQHEDSPTLSDFTNFMFALTTVSLLVPLPATMYFLRPTSERWVVECATIHLALFVVLGVFLTLTVSSDVSIWLLTLVLSVGLCLFFLCAVAGLFAMRISGKMLR